MNQDFVLRQRKEKEDKRAGEQNPGIIFRATLYDPLYLLFLIVLESGTAPYRRRLTVAFCAGKAWAAKTTLGVWGFLQGNGLMCGA